MRVHFFQPAQFNRTADKTNPFFDPIIRVCERERIPYRVFCAERHRSESGYGAKWGNSWFLFLAEVLALRCVKWFKVSPQRSYRVWGWMVNLLTFGRYRADVCIVSAQMHLEILQGVAPKARLVDLQHGVISSTHHGYFDARGRVQAFLSSNRHLEFWLYGEGYRQSFLMNPVNAAVLKGRLHIIGDLLGEQLKPDDSQPCERNAVVFSLQLVSDLGEPMLAAMRDLLWRELEKIDKQPQRVRYRWILKHHPRTTDFGQLDELRRRFPWVELSEVATKSLAARAVLQVTFFSTTAFEYAGHGIPTRFLWDEQVPQGRQIFLEEYAAPEIGTDWDSILGIIGDKVRYQEWCEKFKGWHARFYVPFSEAKCSALLRLRG